MLHPLQLTILFDDMIDDRVLSALDVVHPRFSPHTSTSCLYASPSPSIAHHAEFNTGQGKRNWMRAREALMATQVLDGDLVRLFPICTPGASDSAGFDEDLELLTMGGYSLPEAVLMMIPEP